MLLMLDNYDSFTYNLVQYFGELGQEVMVRRNDDITLEQIKELQPAGLVISPGPRTPTEAGISLAAITEFAGVLPILGVCLGHQAIAQAFGGNVVRAKKVMHGKTSRIRHTHQGLFQDLPDPLTVTRYHSLIVETASLPNCFSVTAWSETVSGEQDEIMGMQHNSLPIHSVQFHPESIMTEYGHQLLGNFLRLMRTHSLLKIGENPANKG